MFISIEGIDGAGKSTQAGLLATALGEGVLLVREPGGTEAGERLRALLKDPGVQLDPRAELLLFAAARAELVEEVIRPALAAGRTVVCDRFTDSTLAYQGAGRGLGQELVEAVNAAAVAGCLPELTILLRLELETAFGRAEDRGGSGADRFESEGLQFQRRIADEYERIAAAEPDRVVAVDGAGSEDEVHTAVLAAVGARSGARG